MTVNDVENGIKLTVLVMIIIGLFAIEGFIGIPELAGPFGLAIGITGMFAGYYVMEILGDGKEHE